MEEGRKVEERGEEDNGGGKAIVRSLPHHVCQPSTLCPLSAVTLRHLLPFCNKPNLSYTLNFVSHLNVFSGSHKCNQPRTS